MTTKEATTNILEYFENNIDVFNECIEDLDRYNGCLGDDRYYYMDELDDLYCGVSVTEILQRACYGYDEDWGVDSSFNPNREYFTFSGHGNLVSASEKDYSAYMDEYAVKNMAEHRNHIWQIKHNLDLSILFDEYDDAEDDDE